MARGGEAAQLDERGVGLTGGGHRLGEGDLEPFAGVVGVLAEPRHLDHRRGDPVGGGHADLAELAQHPLGFPHGVGELAADRVDMLGELADDGFETVNVGSLGRRPVHAR